MTQGKHESTTTIDRLKRKVLGVPIVLWLIGVLGAGVAIAAIVFTLNGVNGVFTIDVAEDHDVSIVPATPSEFPTPQCTWSASGGEVTISDWTPFADGAQCQLLVRFQNNGNTTLSLADYTSQNPDIVVTQDWLGNGNTDALCGFTLAPGEVATGPEWTPILITIVGPGSSPSPGTYSYDMSDIGIEWVDDVADVGDCDSTTA